MMKDLKLQLENARSLPDIFEIVKASVLKSTGKSRSGLMLGMADLGNSPEAFFGAFYPVGSNVIVMNKIPLQRIKETMPELFKPYAFQVLMHEYMHTLGYLDESLVRTKVVEICRRTLGEDHLATRLAADSTSYFKNLVYPDSAWKPDDDRMDLVRDFDRSSASYIA